MNPEIYLEKAFRDLDDSNITLPVAKLLGKQSLMFLVDQTISEENIIRTQNVLSHIFDQIKNNITYNDFCE